MEDELKRIYYDRRTGFNSFKVFYENLLAEGIVISRENAKKWYDSRKVNQVPIRGFKNKQPYHTTIGDGKGFQADILVMPYPKTSIYTGYKYLLTFINTSTRMAYAIPTKRRDTYTLISGIKDWIQKNDIKITSLTSDSEFYNNGDINSFLKSIGVTLYVETPGEHSKLGIINRFHRSLRDLLNRMSIASGSNKWLYFYEDAIYNYNHRVHSTLGKAPADMTEEDIPRLNAKLRRKNIPALINMNKFNIGDKVRILISESDRIQEGKRFKKGGDTFSNVIYTITGKEGNNFIVERFEKGRSIKFAQKYWQLMKV